MTDIEPRDGEQPEVPRRKDPEGERPDPSWRARGPREGPVDNDTRRSFLRSFAGLGLTSFSLLSVGAGMASAKGDSSKNLENPSQVPGCGTYHLGQLWPDIDCGYNTGDGSGNTHTDSACGKPVDGNPNPPASNDHGCGNPIDKGFQSDEACGKPKSSDGTQFWNDLDCGAPTESGGGTHSDSANCGKSVEGGPVQTDSACGYQTEAGPKQDMDCGKTFGVFTFQDNDCGMKMPGGGVSSDDDCGGIRLFPPGIHKDNDCSSGKDQTGGPISIADRVVIDP